MTADSARPADFDLDAYREMARRRDAFLALTGVEIVAVGTGRATARLAVGPEHMNFFDTIHGGMVFALADTAFGVAANTHGRLAAMVDAHITMTRGARPGDLLTAEAEETSLGRTIAVYRVLVTRARDGTEETIASFTGTVYRTARPVMPET